MTFVPMGKPRDLAPGYRWTCPICGDSRTSMFREGDENRRDTLSRAKGALRAHIISSDGDGHGPIHSVPDGITADVLAECIEPVTD